MTAISIAFCLDSIPVVGVVFAPFLGLHGTLYSAALGIGAWMAEAPYDANAYPPPMPPLPSPSKTEDDIEEDDDDDGPYTPIELPIISPPPPLPKNAPQGCLFLSEWGKDRRPGDSGNLAKKRDSFYRMAVAHSGTYTTAYVSSVLGFASVIVSIDPLDATAFSWVSHFLLFLTT